MACLRENGVPGKSVGVFRCPGAFELPQVAAMLARRKRWDAIICLGAVIRGATPHFEYVSAEAARGIQNVAIQYAIPVVFGVLTTLTERQAFERAGGRHGNKGWDAVVTAMEMTDLGSQIRPESGKSKPSKRGRRVD
jgi:6,7-dimethyl-8-ribityllumazine synthase